MAFKVASEGKVDHSHCKDREENPSQRRIPIARVAKDGHREDKSQTVGNTLG